MLLINCWQRGCKAMPDLYLYDDVPVLKNKLGIKDDKTLDLVEAEQSRQKMMILYERGFDDFSPDGLCSIHRACSEIFMTGPGNTDSSTSKNVRAS